MRILPIRLEGRKARRAWGFMETLVLGPRIPRTNCTAKAGRR